MKSTNGLEHSNQELGQRTRMVRTFPNRASYLRMASALVMEQSEEWFTGHHYLDMGGVEPALVAE